VLRGDLTDMHDETRVVLFVLCVTRCMPRLYCHFHIAKTFFRELGATSAIQALVPYKAVRPLKVYCETVDQAERIQSLRELSTLTPMLEFVLQHVTEVLVDEFKMV